MAPRSGFSAQTLSVLSALCSQPSQWKHGYALAKQTGLKSGTLYPILIRLAGPRSGRGVLAGRAASGQAAAAPVPADRRWAGCRCRSAGQRRGRAAARAAASDQDRSGHDGVGAMGWLSRAASRTVAALLPADRSDWAEAIWAEASEVPSGLERARWLAGGVWLIARESLMVRGVRNTILFSVAAVYLAWTAVPGTPSALLTAYIWLRTIGAIVVLAGLPWLVRRRLGPAMDSRLARSLRAATFAAIMALIVALAEVDHITDTPRFLAAAGPHNQPSIGLLLPWSAFLALLAAYAATILAVTAQRSWVSPATLSVGTGAGIALGVVMYAIMPLGVANDATAPWLRGSAIDPLVVVAWILLLGGPLAATLLAGWRCRGPVGPLVHAQARIVQGVTAGALATVVGSLLVCTLGPATMALMPSAGWLVHVLYPDQRLTATAVANLIHGYFPAGYFLIWLAFPAIGFAIGS